VSTAVAPQQYMQVGSALVRPCERALIDDQGQLGRSTDKDTAASYLTRLAQATDRLQQVADGDDYPGPRPSWRQMVKNVACKTPLAPARWRAEPDGAPYRGRHMTYRGYLRRLYEYLQAVYRDPPPSACRLQPVAAHVDSRDPSVLGEALGRMIGQLRRELIGVDYYIHGSFARGDATPFSDVDDLVIVRAEGMRSFAAFAHNIEWLRWAAAMYQRIDPLQHHGHWILAEADLACLEEAKMPLAVLAAGAVIVSGPGRIDAVATRSPDRGREILWCNVQSVRRLIRRVLTDGADANDLKELVSGVALLPALRAMVSGAATGKAAALADMAVAFPEGRPALQWASAVRRDWADLVSMQTLRDLAADLADRGLCRRAIHQRICAEAPRLSSDAAGFAEPVAHSVAALADHCADGLLEDA